MARLIDADRLLRDPYFQEDRWPESHLIRMAVREQHTVDAAAVAAEGGMIMNHDATHCADYTTACPKSCYRAELTADLRKRIDLLWLPVSFAHFKGTKECPKHPEPPKENDYG